jgi:hypothetical protein
MAIASAITRKIMLGNPGLSLLRNRLVDIRKSARKMNGSLGSAMLTLLNARGYLNMAAESSRSLQRTNPRLWNILRYKLNGGNMIYFIVQSMVQEYVDRLTLLEQNPKEFAKVMLALIKAKNTQSIFFP